MLKRIYETWYLRPFFKAFGAIPIAPGQSEKSLETINELLRAGECVCLFPEGAISRNGHLGKFHTGYERALTGVSEGVIIPFYLHGLWGSSLSRAESGLRRARTPELKRDLIVAFGDSLPLATSAKELKLKVFDLSITAWESYSDQLESIALTWLRAAGRNLLDPCFADDSRNTRTNVGMVATATVLARKLALPVHKQCVGILLPPGVQAVESLLALQLLGKVAVPLNDTVPAETFRYLLASAGVGPIISSRAYAHALSVRHPEFADCLSGQDVYYLEDITAGTSPWYTRFIAAAFALLPVSWFYYFYGHPVDADAPAVLLFNELGDVQPRPVALSHRNILANCRQMSDVLNTRLDDVVLSCMPLYHPMGLTLCTLMPLVEGIPIACHGEPTDALGIARTAARREATILPSSPAVLDLYTRTEDVHPLMLDSLRLVVSGPEPVSDGVRESFRLKFGKPVYEGFGVAETTTVATVNIPDALDTSDWKLQRGSSPGTMGMPVPGTSVKIVSPDNDAELPLGQSGLLLVSGSQVMSGYWNDPEQSARALVEMDGRRWLRTGRLAHLTEEGFLVLD